MTTSLPHLKPQHPPLQQWHRATWDDYQALRDDPTLKHVKLSLLTQTIQKLSEGTNTSAAAWFAQAIAKTGS